MAMNIEYAVVGNCLVPRSIAPLVLEQRLGEWAPRESILLDPSAPAEPVVRQLLDRCREGGCCSNFTVSGITGMVNKFLTTNAPSRQQVRITLCKGKEHLFLMEFIR